MKKTQLKDWAVVAGSLLLIVAVVAGAIAYGVFYWQHCAFVPIKDMPGLCLGNRGGGR